MKSMLQNMIACALVAVFVPLLAQGESLMPCPDCEKMVSRRALMCPNCGCKGAVIAEEAARLAKAEEPPPPDDAILADFGDREGTKLVDIYYDAADADNDLLKVRIEISDNDGAKYSVPAFSLTGDIGEGIAPGTGKHIVWDAGTDWDGEYSDQMRVKVFAIDAQGFPGMEWGNEVPPGGFLMGQDGGAEGSGPSRHVNIPWSYWLGKYEVTVQQYCDFLNAAYTAGKIRRNGTSAVYSITGTNLLSRIDGEFLLCDIGDNYRIRWNVNNFEVVGNYTNYPASVTWYGAMAFANFYGYEGRCGRMRPTFDNRQAATGERGATFDIRRPTTQRRPAADDREVGATLDIRRPTTGWRHSTTDSRLLSVGRLPAVGRRMSNVALTQNIMTERLLT